MVISELMADPTDPRTVHFVGLGGAGMSGLAELFVRRGIPVSGCDAAAIPADFTTRLGIVSAQGHSPDHINDVRAVVVSSAVPKDHPELRRAAELGVPVIRRAEALAAAVEGGT